MNEEELCAVATSHLAHDTAAAAITVVVLVEDIRLRATACSLVVVALHDIDVPNSVIVEDVIVARTRIVLSRDSFLGGSGGGLLLLLRTSLLRLAGDPDAREHGVDYL